MDGYDTPVIIFHIYGKYVRKQYCRLCFELPHMNSNLNLAPVQFRKFLIVVCSMSI